MVVLISIVAGIVPMLIYPLVLYWLDRYEKEPAGLLIAGFLWGFVPAALFSLITQLVLDLPLFLLDETGTLSNVVGASLLAPVTEEFFKGIAVWLIYLLWRNEFDGVFDGIIYGSLVGFGFAAIENVLYFISFGADPALIVLRAFVFGLNHAFYTSLTGIGFGLARHTRSGFVRQLLPLLGLAAAISAHSLHNLASTFAEAYPALFLLAIIADYAGIFFVFVIILLSLRRERQWIIEQLREEVGRRTLSEAHYGLISMPLGRTGAQLSALFSHGPTAYVRVRRYFHVLTELAYKKHARQRRGDEGAQAAQIENLRAQAASLSAELGGVLT